jgi:hypothetical protein
MSVRHYNPSTGRFLSEDPSGLNGGLNLYQYVLANPVNYVDYNGKHPVAVAAVGAGALAGAATGLVTGFFGSNACTLGGKLGDALVGLGTGALGGAIAGLGAVTRGLIGTVTVIGGSMATGAGAEAISLFGDFGSGGGGCNPPPPSCPSGK